MKNLFPISAHGARAKSIAPVRYAAPGGSEDRWGTRNLNRPRPAVINVDHDRSQHEMGYGDLEDSCPLE